MKIAVIPKGDKPPIFIGNVAEITFSEPMYGPTKRITGEYNDGNGLNMTVTLHQLKSLGGNTKVRGDIWIQ